MRHADGEGYTCKSINYYLLDNIILCSLCGCGVKDLRTEDERRADSAYGAWEDWDTLEQESD